MSNNTQDAEVQAEIKRTVEENKIVIFMKGSPMYPQCGFSAQSAGILRELGEPFAYVDVLEIPAARQGVKDFTNWPTIPQIFINGEFVGGCDILRALHASGELQQLVAGEASAEASE